MANKKYQENKRKFQAEIEAFVNQAINDFIKNENPSKVIIEELTFVKNKNDKIKKNYSKKVKRYLSSWQKGYLQNRLNYKLVLNGIEIVLVNPAYTSKVCSRCGCFGERNGVHFNCKHCGLCINADINASKNILKRMLDTEITLHTCYQDVKKILESREKRLLENTIKGITGPTKTLDTYRNISHSKSELSEMIG